MGIYEHMINLTSANSKEHIMILTLQDISLKPLADLSVGEVTYLQRILRRLQRFGHHSKYKRCKHDITKRKTKQTRFFRDETYTTGSGWSIRKGFDSTDRNF